MTKSEPLKGKIRDIIEMKYVDVKNLYSAIDWIKENRARCVKCNNNPPTEDCLNEHLEFIIITWKDMKEGLPDLFRS